MLTTEQRERLRTGQPFRLTAGQRVRAVTGALMFRAVGNPKAASQCAAMAFHGTWEGTEQNRYRNRPSVTLQSVDHGLDYGVRDAFISEGRALEQVHGIIGNILTKYANHVIGDCRVTWDTGDEKVDELYAGYWEFAMKIIDADGKWHFPKMSKIVTQTTLREGGIFAQKVLSDDPQPFLQLRLIEPDRVRNSAGVMDYNTEDSVGGIILAPNGRPRAYRVWDRPRKYGNVFVNPREVPANEIIHVMDSTRADSIIGVTAFKAVLNKLRDEKEITDAEVQSVKRNSKLALLLKTTTGPLTQSQAEMLGMYTGTDGTSETNGANKVDVMQVNNAVDAYMWPGEDIKAHESTRPSQGWFDLMRWMIHHIAIGVNLPFEVVWSMAGLPGPAVRFTGAQASRTFKGFREDVIEPRWITPVVGAVTANGIAMRRIPFHPRWDSYRGGAPSDITIDVGRESSAWMNEIACGAGTLTDWYAEDGKVAKQQIRQWAKELRWKMEALESEGLDPELHMRAPSQTASVSQNAGQPAEEPVQKGRSEE